MIRLVFISAVVLFAGVVSALAQDAAGGPVVREPIVHVEVEPDIVSVGQPVRLRITILGPTWFPKPPIYSTFEIPNAVTRLPPNSSFPTSERIDGVTWSGIVRTYQIYPLLAATYELSGQSVTITFADPQTQKPVETLVRIPMIRFSGMVPKGAETLDPFLAGTKLTLSQDVRGETESIKVGDAIVRTVTARLEGMPVMFLPVLIGGEPVAGTSVMARQPSIEEKPGSRGAPLVSTRSESMTYVFETGGDRVLPAIALSWWNTETMKVETVSVPEISISVLASETPSGDEAATGFVDSIRAIPRWQIAGFAGVLIVLWVALAYRRRIAAFFIVRWQRYQTSEPTCFRRLKKAVRSAPLFEIDRALREWMAHFPPVGAIGDLARRVGRTDIAADLNGIVADGYGREVETGASLPRNVRDRLGGSLKDLRTNLNRHGNDRTTGSGPARRLSALNP